MNSIDPRAVIDPRAEIAEGVTIGPYAVVGPQVSIGAGTSLGPHAVVEGPTRIGRDNRIFQFASIGAAPQDKKYAGEETWLEIGDRNVFREFTTVNRGTAQGGGITRIGDDNWIMAYCHIAHDCVVGNGTIFSNSASLAGHVTVEDHASLAGFVLVHQFCRIGAYSFSAFGSVVNRDVPPYVTVSGRMAEPYGINAEGLRRHGMNPDTIRAIKRAYKTLYMGGLRLEEAKRALAETAATNPEIAHFLEFLERSERGIVR